MAYTAPVGSDKTCLTCDHRRKLHMPKRHICKLDSDFHGECRVQLGWTCDRWKSKPSGSEVPAPDAGDFRAPSPWKAPRNHDETPR